MPYIGSVPTTSFTSLAKQDITGNGGTDYTLSNSVTNANDLAVFLNNVRQEPTEAYTASGTTLSMTGAIHSSDNFYVIFLGQAIQTSNPPDGSVSTSQIANDSVTSAKTNFVSTSSVAGLQIKGDGTTDGTLQLNCSQNSHGIKLKSPNHGAGQSYTLTFPSTTPQADKALITDGSGNLSFGDAGGGKVLQVLYQPLNITSGVTSGSTSFTTFVSQAITPSSTSSKILIIATINCYITSGTSYDGPQSSSRLLRGSTHIAGNNFFYQRDNVNSTKYQAIDHNISFLDSPNSTSAVTYNLQSRYQFGNGMTIRNAMMTLMEIAQ